VALNCSRRRPSRSASRRRSCRGLGFDVVARGFHLPCQFGLARLRLALAGERQEAGLQRAVGIQAEEAARHLGLHGELFQLPAEFLADVGNPVQVFPRVAQPGLGFARRSLYFDTPAASSRKPRNSSAWPR